VNYERNKKGARFFETQCIYPFPGGQGPHITQCVLFKCIPQLSVGPSQMTSKSI